MTTPDPTEREKLAAEWWRSYMTAGQTPEGIRVPWFEQRWLRPLARALPSEPRCRICYYPFAGPGGWLARALLGIAPSPLNPHLCNICERSASYFQGGAEVEMSLLFVDVRGSTGIAERISPVAFSRLIDRFYRAATRVLYKHNGLVEKLIGDEVTGFFVPGIAGPDHARAAIRAGEAILHATGHGEADGAWVPVGVGVHTGQAFVGAVGGADGAPDITVLGDAVNVAARIASQARPGEMLFSEAARQAAGLPPDKFTRRQLTLKGRTEPVDVWSLVLPPSGPA